MQCDDFLEGYSDFVDGRFEPPEHAPFERHLERCDACARYDRVVQRGLFICRDSGIDSITWTTRAASPGPRR